MHMNSINNKDYVKIIGKLKNARLKAKLTQPALANKINVDQTFISKYESRERRLDIIEVRTICKGLKINFVEFVKEFKKEI